MLMSYSMFWPRVKRVLVTTSAGTTARRRVRSIAVHGIVILYRRRPLDGSDIAKIWMWCLHHLRAKGCRVTGVVSRVMLEPLVEDHDWLLRWGGQTVVDLAVCRLSTPVSSLSADERRIGARKRAWLRPWRHLDGRDLRDVLILRASRLSHHGAIAVVVATLSRQRETVLSLEVRWMIVVRRNATDSGAWPTKVTGRRSRQLRGSCRSRRFLEVDGPEQRCRDSSATLKVKRYVGGSLRLRWLKWPLWRAFWKFFRHVAIRRRLLRGRLTPPWWRWNSTVSVAEHETVRRLCMRGLWRRYVIDHLVPVISLWSLAVSMLAVDEMQQMGNVNMTLPISIQNYNKKQTKHLK